MSFIVSLHEAAHELWRIQPIVNLFVGHKFREEREEFFTNVLPPRLEALDRLLGDKRFFCGAAAAYCDLEVYHHLDLCRLVVTDVFDGYPRVGAWMARVEALPGVRDYLASRPEAKDVGMAPFGFKVQGKKK